MLAPCDSFPCLNNGDSYQLKGIEIGSLIYICDCATHYELLLFILCLHMLAPCDLFPCLNNGDCLETDGFESGSLVYICDCATQYESLLFILFLFAYASPIAIHFPV